MEQLLFAIEWIFIVLLAVQVGYLLFFSIAGKIAKKQSFPMSLPQKKIRILIPAYKEDAVIISTAQAALKQEYPKDLYEVVVIADSLKPCTIEKLHALPLKVIKVKFEKSTKGRALHEAIEVTRHMPSDIILILDADNHMAPDFLLSVNNAFTQGYEVIQGHRTAKNIQTAFAFLDACTEEINNHIFRRGHVGVGLPSALIGSGMAFSWSLFLSLIQDIGDTSGEDKEIEFRLARQHKKIAFLDGAYVFDEKVSKTAVFAKQRSRWLAMQLEFFSKYFIEGWVQLFKGNVAFFNKVFQTYLLPRILLVALVTMWLLYSILFQPKFILFGILLVTALCVALFSGIPSRWLNKQLIFAIMQIPVALLGICRSIWSIRTARKKFIHTPHGEN